VAHTGQIATGVGTPGNAIRFARIGSSGRADYVAIQESTGALYAWLNTCEQRAGTESGTGSGTTTDTSPCATPPLPTKTMPENEPSATAAWTNLDSFTKCGDGAGSMKEQLTTSWNSMIKFAELVNGELNFDQKMSRDYLGPRSKMNWKHEQSFKGLISAHRTWFRELTWRQQSLHKSQPTHLATTWVTTYTFIAVTNYEELPNALMERRRRTMLNVYLYPYFSSRHDRLIGHRLKQMLAGSA
jgi:hypothetical protein